MKLKEVTPKAFTSKSGIYKLSIGGHIYIGSSKNLYQRLSEHRNDLRHDAHSNEFLQKAVNKYGFDNVEAEIVEYCDPEVRIQKESEWIKKTNADLNLVDPADLTTLSSESRAKLSRSIKKGLQEGKYQKPTDHCSVIGYDYFGNRLGIYSSRKEAAEAFGLTEKDVQKAAGNYRKGVSVHGYRFRYSISQVPEQKFPINPQYVGQYYDFYYKDSTGEEKFAFHGIKDVYAFLAKIIQEGSEIVLIPKLKNSVNLQKPLEDGNAVPSTEEIR